MSRTATVARPSDDQNAVQSFVNREVHYCVSGLVSTLAQGVGRSRARGHDTLTDLSEQAQELCSPIADYEEAAIQDGARRDLDRSGWVVGDNSYFDTAEEYCEERGLDPYDREVFEHWIVSDWLAEKLAAHGEKVDADFAGMTVWARTTTGQGIASDGVIERIYDELHAGSEA